MTIEPTERQYQGMIMEALQVMGWKAMHVFPLMDRHGVYRTPTTAKGFPDITALRGEWILSIEVKGPKTPFQPGQIEWLEAFATIPTGRGWALRPSKPDLKELVAWLRKPAEAPRRFGYTVPTVGLAR